MGSRRLNLSLPRDLIAWGLGRRKLYRVKGRSMCPLLNDGDYVLVKLWGDRKPQVGQVVVAKHPESGRVIIKRVLSMGAQAAYLASDNPGEGTDSRHFGSVSCNDIIGTVVQIHHR